MNCRPFAPSQSSPLDRPHTPVSFSRSSSTSSSFSSSFLFIPIFRLSQTYPFYPNFHSQTVTSPDIVFLVNSAKWLSLSCRSSAGEPVPAGFPVQQLRSQFHSTISVSLSTPALKRWNCPLSTVFERALPRPYRTRGAYPVKNISPPLSTLITFFNFDPLIHRTRTLDTFRLDTRSRQTRN